MIWTLPSKKMYYSCNVVKCLQAKKKKTRHPSPPRAEKQTTLDYYTRPIANCGNTCYMNSMVQLLLHNLPFVSILLQYNGKDTLAAAFRRVLSQSYSGAKDSTPISSIQYFRDKLNDALSSEFQYESNTQDCTTRFFTDIMEVLHKDPQMHDKLESALAATFTRTRDGVVYNEIAW